MHMTASDLPDLKFTQAGNLRQTQPLTMNNVEKVMEVTNTSVRMDVMTGDMSFKLGDETIPQDRNDIIIEGIIDNLIRVDVGVNVSRVYAMIKALANDKQFHPMEERLQALPPSNGRAIDDLIDSVKTESELWPIFVENWLIQVVDAVCGWRRPHRKALDYVLVLVGNQGVGKSHWLAQLGGDFFKGEAALHLRSANSKDHQIAALRQPMVELSELDGMFKKNDIEDIKTFISATEDEIRLPYDRRATRKPRMTCFCASVNSVEFLNDPTGNRRFLPVEVESIDRNYKINWDGVWREAYDIWQNDPDYRLSEDDTRQVNEINRTTFTMLSNEEETISEYLDRHEKQENKYPLKPMSTLNVLQMIFGKNVKFSNKQKSDSARYLRERYGKHRTIDGKQRAWLIPFNDMADDRQFWSDKITHISGVKKDER